MGLRDCNISCTVDRASELLANIGFCAYYTLCNGRGDTTEERGTHIHVYIYTWPSLQSLRGWGFDGLRKGSRGVERMYVGGGWGEKSEYGRGRGQCACICVCVRVRVEMTTTDGRGSRMWGCRGGYEIWNFVIRSPVYISYRVYIRRARDTDTDLKRVGNGRGVWSGRVGELINNSIPF